jgi:hypothetical protein
MFYFIMDKGCVGKVNLFCQNPRNKKLILLDEQRETSLFLVAARKAPNLHRENGQVSYIIIILFPPIECRDKLII